MIDFDTDLSTYLPEQVAEYVPEFRIEGQLDPVPGKRNECQFCGDKAITRPLATMNPDTGQAQQVHACADCQTEQTEERIQQAREQAAQDTPDKDELAEATAPDQVSAQEAAQMSPGELAEAIERGRLDPDRIEGTPATSPAVGDDA